MVWLRSEVIGDVLFYSLIKKKRDRWYNSSECTVKELIEYMANANKLRDVQIDAIKTYLFLKIKVTETITATQSTSVKMCISPHCPLIDGFG